MSQKSADKPIAIAADHRGVAMKARLIAWLNASGYSAKDCGTDNADARVDAMDYALACVAEIKARRSDFAVAICGSGQMMAITANRFPFIRATLLHTAEECVGAREHGDANVLVLGADVTDEAAAEKILKTFLSTASQGDRYAVRREKLARLDVSGSAIAQRNKDNYLKAKAAFNEKNMAECMSYYAPDHQIRSRPAPRGREQIEQFLAGMHEAWSDLKIVVDHAIAEDDWVAGRCTSTGIHSKSVMGVAPTNREVRTTFWDMHRFNDEGKIIETWNVLDSLAIMQQLGLVPGGK